MTSIRALHQQLIDAQTRLDAAYMADVASNTIDHTKNYSHAYLEAWWHWQQTYRTWRQVYEEVCFPLTAIGVLYDDSIEFQYDVRDEPTVKLAAIKGTAKLPVVTFPKEKAA